jgi:hypothetical protein
MHYRRQLISPYLASFAGSAWIEVDSKSSYAPKRCKNVGVAFMPPESCGLDKPVPDRFRNQAPTEAKETLLHRTCEIKDYFNDF